MDNPTTEAAAAPRYVRTDEYDFSAQGHRRQLDAAFGRYRPLERDDASSRLRRLVARTLLGARHARPPAGHTGRGGLFDAEDCYGAWTTYASIRRQSPPHVVPDGRRPVGARRLAVVERRQPARQDALGDASLTDYYQQRIEVPFFNYYLLGKGDGGELVGATIFFTGENRWRTFEEWPPADARKEVLLSSQQRRAVCREADRARVVQRLSLRSRVARAPTISRCGVA